MTRAPQEVHSIQRLLERLHARHARLDEGEVATCIPELSKADPADFGICVVSAERRVFEVGDSRKPFTMQSVSKPLVFGIAVEALGHDAALEHVDVEPSGDAFDSIQLQPGTNTPFDPLINAGAIAVAGALHARFGDEAFAITLERMSEAAGRPHVHLRHVRLLGAVGLPGRRPSQERRQRRRDGGRQAPARDRDLLAEARPAGQQPARHRGVRRARGRTRAARLRLHELRLELPEAVL
jgi:hypothetical protein